MSAPIVVGYDGSAAARAAVSLAARRAGHGRKLFVVHAYEVPAEYLGWPDANRMLGLAAERGRELLDRLPDELGGALAGVDWESELLAGAPAPAIVSVAETRGAQEIVLGSRGVGRLRGLLGSVAHEVLHQAHCPVTVVPERAVAQAAAAPAKPVEVAR